tara:strand:- start:1061 stop:1843 length:783 start_codon:yes stop_codon:yes gene_type:complete
VTNSPTVVKAQGICNRIKTYMTLLSEHDQVNTEVFADSYIFPSIKYKEDFEEKDRACGWRLNVLPEEENYIEKYKTIDFLYHDTPKYFIEKYLKSLSRIEINSDIIEYADNFLEDWSNVIGVHIRSWWSAGPPRLNWHDNKLFEDEIEKFDSDKKIFLCSDNPEVVREFKAKYGKRIIVHEQKSHENYFHPYDSHYEDIQLVVDGFIDCLLLSKCDKIIGTWGSTFSEVAWWLGGCNSEIITPKSPNVSKKDESDLFTLK